jgi:hypothetical protein
MGILRSCRLEVVGYKPQVPDSLIDTFCVHARALLYFFSDSDPQADDAIASNFASNYEPIDLTTEPVRSLLRKLNKQIFHLTKNR